MPRAGVAKKRVAEGAEGISFQAFQQPAMEFRPTPFWGLNDRLDDKELQRQIRQMKAHGWGGFFIHPRFGMETPYLTEEYFDRIRTIVKTAAHDGLNVWIYDEHPFPAVCSGGLVGAESRANRHKCLVMRMHSRLTPIEEGVAYYAATVDRKGKITGLRAIPDPKRFRGDESLFIHLYQWTDPVQPSTHTGITDDFMHGFPYTDTLRPQAVRRFIELTYEGYRRAVGGSFGKIVKGMFSDIPVYQWHYGTPRPSIPWTPELPSYFRKACGYDLLPELPSLFFDIGEYSRVRHDFWKAVNRLFLESCTKQLYRWCDKHGLQYTAHYWGEEALHWQVPWTGDVMTHFEWQHVVSIDHILRNIEDPLGVKQASSVVEQLGKPRTISETYALCGHDLTYEERKWIGDWEYALGINFLVPYIPAYSMRGRRKRDEPPSEFFQQPYWEHENLQNDYFGRLSYALTCGRQVADVLLLQPLATAWILYKPSSSQPAAYRPHPDPFEAAGAALYHFSQKFTDACAELLRIHRDFHIGNETLLAEHGTVEGSTLRVGRCNYKVVIVPPSVNWCRTTVKLLSDFVEAGGRVVAMSPVPTMVEGRNATALPRNVTMIEEGRGLGQVLDEVLPPDVAIDGGADIIYQHRCSGDEHIYFFANTSMSTAYPDTAIQVSTNHPLQLWNPLNGERMLLASTSANGCRRFRLDFPPVASYLLIATPEGVEGLPDFQPLPSTFSATHALSPRWNLRRRDPNALNLDFCDLRVGDGAWTERIPIWKAHLLVHAAGAGNRFQLRFRFDIETVPKSLMVVLESPERYDILVNDTHFAKREVGRWFDSSLHVFDVRSLVHKGQNTIVMAGVCVVDTELESIYLTGDFGLQKDHAFCITTEPGTVNGVNLTKEGYPFFTGHLTLAQDFPLDGSHGRVFVKFGALHAMLAKLRINGNNAGLMAWKPYVLEVTNYVKDGNNRIEIELCSSLHNLLGPHHDIRGEARHFVLQQSWTDVQHWTDDYFFVPLGVEKVEIAITN